MDRKVDVPGWCKRVEREEEDLREAQKESHNVLVRRAENQMCRVFLVEEVCARFMFEKEAENG